MYEYKVIQFNGAGNLERDLNIEAEDGWRLVQAIHHSPATYFVFEKPKMSVKSTDKGST